MNISDRIVEEIKRYNDINKYIMEQVPQPPEEGAIPPEGGAIPPEGGAIPPEGGAIPPEGGAIPPVTTIPPTDPTSKIVDVATDPDVEEVGGEKMEDSDTEEIDISDLVQTQKTMSDKQEEYFNNLFTQLETLQTKLGEMDQLVQKLDNIEMKVDKFKPKTPEEKLELRSLDSGPFKQKLSDFFQDKLPEMEKSGKNEYVLTSDEIENYDPSQVKSSFDDVFDSTNQNNNYK